MARKLRIEYPGATSVMNRGDRREPIFKDDADRQSRSAHARQDKEVIKSYIVNDNAVHRTYFLSLIFGMTLELIVASPSSNANPTSNARRA